MATQQPFDTEDAVRRFVEGGRNVKLGPGVVGKTSRAVLGLLALWAIIAWRISPDRIADVMLLGVGVVATGAFIWWTRETQRFAHDNPAQAMLEGAQFLEYQKFEAAIKGSPGPSTDKPTALLK